MRCTGGKAGAGQADGALDPFLLMVDDETRAAIFTTAIALQQHALSLNLPIDDGFEDLAALTEEEIEEHDRETEMEASQVMYLGNLVSIVAATLPPPDSTGRGPYNQYQKCTQFFTVSMGWPDRQFRHEYRSETIFFAAVLWFESLRSG